MVGFSLFFIILPHNLTKSMKYYEVLFRIEAPQELYQDACDTVAALAGSASFETFEEVEGGLKGYVQQSLFSQDELEEVMSMLPFNDVHLTFEVTEAEDKASIRMADIPTRLFIVIYSSDALRVSSRVSR